MGQLAPRCHVELPEDLAEVVVHCARAEEQPSGDLAVGGALGGQERDLRLLGGEVAASVAGSYNTAPPAITSAIYTQQSRNPGVTETVTIPGRGHALVIDSGWREVCDTSLAFIRRFVP